MNNTRTRVRSNQSIVWNYFTLNQTKEEAECNKCKNVIKCKGLSTSELLRHLEIKHNIKKNATEELDKPVEKKNRK